MDGPACPIVGGSAVAYISKVQKRFQTENPEVYQQFLKILMDYQKDPRFPIDVQEKVNTLFSGDPDLIEGFKQFMPAEGSQENPKEDQRKTVVSERHQQFMKLIIEYNENPTTLAELSGQLKSLYSDNPALMKMLDQFMAGGSAGGSAEQKQGLKATTEGIS